MVDPYSSGILPNGARVPESVRARMMMGQLLAQGAGAPSAPYTSKGVVGLKALQGFLGGQMEGSAAGEIAQGQQQGSAAMIALANALHPGSGGPPAPAPSAPMPQAGAGMIPGSASTGPSNALPTGNAGARDLAIRTIYGEAGGEPAQGQAGVAAVLKNRLASGQFGNDMSSVILAPKQFSLWNPGDPAGATASRLDPSSPAYQHIGQIYDGVMSGQIQDPTGGATHYYNPRSASPAWGPQLAAQNDVTIGNHRFVGAGAAGPNGGTASADMPAPNAQPVASNTLPPGITPDMVSAPPKPSLDDIVTGAMAKAGMDTSGLPGNAQSAPAAAPASASTAPLIDPTPMAQQGGAGGPAPDTGSTLPSDPPLPPPGVQSGAQPGNPFGAMPQSMAQAPASAPQSVGGSNPGAAANLSPNGAMMAAMGPNDMDPGFAAALASNLSGNALPVNGLSTAQLPGMDNFAGTGDGSVRQTSIVAPDDPSSTPGFTGSFGNGIQPQVSGTLPPPDMLAGGQAFPSTPTPSPHATALATALGGGSLPDTGPMPPPGGQSLAAAEPDPDVPAPNAVPAGPAPLPSMPPAAAPISNGANAVPGNAPSADPSSPQSFMQQELARQLGGSAASATSAPATDQQGSGGLQGALASLLGGTSDAGSAPTGSPSPSATGGSMASPAQGGNAAQIRALASSLAMNQYADPAAREMAMKFLFAQPQVEKMEDGSLVSIDPYTHQASVLGRYGKAVDLAQGHGLHDPYTGAPIGATQPFEPKFGMNRDGIIYNERTGEKPGDNGQPAYRFMTPEEKQAAGIPADQPMQVGPNGAMHSPGGVSVNVGGEQNVYDTAMAKTLAENHQGLMQGVDANRTKLQQLNAMSGALQRLQQNGGTTGLGQDEILHMQSAVNTGANALGLGQQFDVSDKEVLGKLARQISGGMAKDIGGARTTNFDMQTMLSANPGLEISPTSNQRMLGIDQQLTQRKIDIGQAMQNAAAMAVQQGRRVNPQQMEQIRADYDAQHHVMDPVTGQDLSTSPKLPEFQQGQANAAATQGAAPAAPTLQQIQAEIARRRATGGQ